ncbi:MAG TPA: Do family serine endopeptidase [Phycisphaerae bacterium]|nr:Do family serine endopeptidase [Phycisphaerae bacterium]
MKLVKASIPVAVLLAVVAAGVLYAPTLADRIAYGLATGENRAVRADLAELSKHDQMSVLFRAVAKSVQPAVVVVKVKTRVKIEDPFNGLDDFFKRFEEDMPGRMPRFRRAPRQSEPREFFAHGIGSGVIVDAANGYVLTNWHVVRNADEVEVMLADERTLDAEWVRTDRQTDLAIIKIKPNHLIDAPLGDSDKMEVGDCVLAIGAPRGLPKTVTAGIISAKGRVASRGGYQSFLQTDAAINKGNSGGPLVNMRGEVIGINTAIVSSIGGNEGIGLAIPSNMVKDIMTQLVEKGAVTRGFLGVSIQDVDEKLAKSFDLPHSRGALVSMVAAGSPAAKAGIRPGDFIVSVNGERTGSVNELRNEVASIRPGSKVKLELYRKGEKITVEVKVEAQPADVATAFGHGEPAPATTEKFGLTVATMDDELARKYGYKKSPRGVVITDVVPTSDAAEQDLREGMVILQVGGKDVQTAEDFDRAVSANRAASGVRLLVTDAAGGRRFVFIAPMKEK